MKKELLFILALIPAALAAGQNRPATSVQLPTFGYNTVTTTVSVPDRGSTYMGGINRSSMGRVESGAPLLPFKNRSIGYETGASSFRTSVYIHDFEAMDEQLLGGDSAPQGPAIVNGDRVIPIRYVSTQPKTNKIAKHAPQVAVRKKTKSASQKDAPLVLSGKTSNALILGNVKEPLKRP